MNNSFALNQLQHAAAGKIAGFMNIAHQSIYHLHFFSLAQVFLHAQICDQ